MSPSERLPWENRASRAQEKYEAKLREFRNGRSAREPSRPPAAFFDWRKDKMPEIWETMRDDIAATLT